MRYRIIKTRKRYALLALLPLLLAAWVVMLFSISASHGEDQAEASANLPNVCGSSAAAPARYDHVVWVLEENRSFTQVMNPARAPFITDLARQCAYSTRFLDNEPRTAFGSGYHSVSHYLADASGSNCTVGNARTGLSCLGNSASNPAKTSLPTVSIFEQLANAGLSWKSYQESSPANCSLKSHGAYVARHDAALYFTRIRQACQKYDVPIPTLREEPSGALIDDIQQGTLPAFSYVTPNLNNDMHNGGVSKGDAWLRAYLVPLLKSPTYKAGRTAVFIIWDEAPKATDTLPNLIIAPTAHSGASVTPINGFAVLGATEKMLGLQPLGCATGLPPGGNGQCYTGASTDLRMLLSI